MPLFYQKTVTYVSSLPVTYLTSLYTSLVRVCEANSCPQGNQATCRLGFASGKLHSFRMPDKRCLSLRQRMTVFGFFGGGCCRSVRARGYAPLRGAGGRRRARGYAPLRGAAFRNVGAANFNPPAGRPQILNSPFSIFNSAAGRRPESGRPTLIPGPWSLIPGP